MLWHLWDLLGCLFYFFNCYFIIDIFFSKEERKKVEFLMAFLVFQLERFCSGAGNLNFRWARAQIPDKVFTWRKLLTTPKRGCAHSFRCPLVSCLCACAHPHDWFASFKKSLKVVLWSNFRLRFALQSYRYFVFYLFTFD